MPLGGPSIADVNQEAHRLIEERAKQRGIPLDATAAETAALVPPFSKGTTALDPTSGEPIIGGGQPVADVTSDAGGDAMAAAQAEIAGEPEPTAPKKRDSKTGQFIAEKPAAPVAAVEPAPTEQPAAVAAQPAQAASEAAAEAVAGEATDPWAAYEEIEYEDPTLEKKFKVRVPKDDAKLLRGGYMRQADYSRKTLQLAAARNALLPLIEDGSISNLLPLIAMGTRDQEFAQVVAEIAQRRVRGEPMLPAATVAAPQPTQPPSQPSQEFQLDENADPYLAGVLKQTVQPVAAQLEELRGMVKGMATTEEQRAAAEQAAVRENNRRIGVMMASHQALSQWFPDEFSGDINKDGELFQRVATYARDSGFAQAYPDNPLAMAMAWRQYHDSRAQSASSPAVAAVEQRDVERRVATATAAAIPAGTPTTPQTKPKIPPMPPTRVNGVPVPPKEYAAAVAARNRAIAAAQQHQ